MGQTYRAASECQIFRYMLMGVSPTGISGREKPADWYNQSPPWQSVKIPLGDWRILVPCLN